MANFFDDIDADSGKKKDTAAPSPAAEPIAPSPSGNFFDTISPEEGMPSAVEGVDEELVSNVMAKAIAAGQPISREEAVGRAINLNKVIREGAPTISQGTGRSRLGTITENFIHGVTPFGLSRSAEMFAGKLGEMAGFENNPFTAENMEGRAAEFPTEAHVSEVVGGVLPAGTGAIRALAPKIFAKVSSIPGLGAVLRSVENMDFVGRTAGRVSAEMQAGTLSRLATKEVNATAKSIEEAAVAEGRGLTDDELTHIDDLYAGAQKSFGSYVDDAGGEYNRLKALRTQVDAGAAKMSSQEADLLKVFEEGSKPGVIRGAKATARAAERAKVERAKFLVSQRVKDQSRSMGWGDKYQLAFANAVGVAAGGAVGALPKAAKEIEEYFALTDEQVASMGEHAAAKMLGNAALDIGEGAGLALGIGMAAPMAFEGASLATRLVRKSTGALVNKLAPIVAEKLSGGKVLEADVARGFKIADLAADVDLSRDIKGFRRSAQYQYDNAESYLDNLTESISNNPNSPLKDYAEQVRTRFEATLKALRKNYMVERNGKYFYTGKLDGVIENGRVSISPVDPAVPFGPKKYDFKLPPEFEELGNIFGAAELLAAREMNISPPSLLQAEQLIDAVPPIPGSTAGQRYLGAEPNMQSSFFPEGKVPLLRGQELIPVGGAEPYAGMDRNLRLPVETPLQAAKLGALESAAGQALERGDTKKTIMDALGYYVANQVAGGYGMAGKLVFDLAVDTKALVNSYAVAQRYAAGLERSLGSVAKFVARDPRTAAQASRALLEGKGKSFQMDLTQEIGLSDKAASEYYYADKALLDKLTGADGVEKTSELFSSDYAMLDATYPKLSADTSMLVPRAISFLKSKMDMMKVPYGYEPSKQQLYSYGLYSRYIHDPEAIYADIASREYVSTQALEVLQNVYPATYRQLKNKIFDELILARGADEKLSRKQQGIVDKLLGNGTSGFTTQQIKNIQDSMNMSPPSKGGPTSSKRVELEREGTSQQ